MVKGNMSGLREAGWVWANHYDKFMLGCGFQRSAVDRRVYYRRSPEGFIIVAIHVDNNFSLDTCKAMAEEFDTAWTKRFGAKVDP